MTELSFEYPERGEARSASDAKIRTALVAIEAANNTNLESLAGTYRTLLTVNGALSGSTGTTKYLLGSSSSSSSFIRLS